MTCYFTLTKNDINLNVGIWNFLINISFNKYWEALSDHGFFVPFLNAKNPVWWSLGIDVWEILFGGILEKSTWDSPSLKYFANGFCTYISITYLNIISKNLFLCQISSVACLKQLYSMKRQCYFFYMDLIASRWVWW